MNEEEGLAIFRNDQYNRAYGLTSPISQFGHTTREQLQAKGIWRPPERGFMKDVVTGAETWARSFGEGIVGTLGSLGIEEAEETYKNMRFADRYRGHKAPGPSVMDKIAFGVGSVGPDVLSFVIPALGVAKLTKLAYVGRAAQLAKLGKGAQAARVLATTGPRWAMAAHRATIASNIFMRQHGEAYYRYLEHGMDASAAHGAALVADALSTAIETLGGPEQAMFRRIHGQGIKRLMGAAPRLSNRGPVMEHILRSLRLPTRAIKALSGSGAVEYIEEIWDDLGKAGWNAIVTGDPNFSLKEFWDNRILTLPMIPIAGAMDFMISPRNVQDGLAGEYSDQVFQSAFTKGQDIPKGEIERYGSNMSALKTILNQQFNNAETDTIITVMDRMAVNAAAVQNDKTPNDMLETLTLAVAKGEFSKSGLRNALEGVATKEEGYRKLVNYLAEVDPQIRTAIYDVGELAAAQTAQMNNNVMATAATESIGEYWDEDGTKLRESLSDVLAKQYVGVPVVLTPQKVRDLMPLPVFRAVYAKGFLPNVKVAGETVSIRMDDSGSLAIMPQAEAIAELDIGKEVTGSYLQKLVQLARREQLSRELDRADMAEDVYGRIAVDPGPSVLQATIEAQLTPEDRLAALQAEQQELIQKARTERGEARLLELQGLMEEAEAEAEAAERIEPTVKRVAPTEAEREALSVAQVAEREAFRVAQAERVRALVDIVKQEQEATRQGVEQLRKFRERYGGEGVPLEIPVVVKDVEGLPQRPQEFKSFEELADALDKLDEQAFAPEEVPEAVPEAAPQLQLPLFSPYRDLSDSDRTRAFYHPDYQMMVFGENATTSDVIHEWFHHMVTGGFLPVEHMNILAISFPDANDRLGINHEQTVDALMRYIRYGEFPDTKQNIAAAFQHLKLSMGEAYNTYEKDMFSPEVKDMFDSLFVGIKQTEESTLAGFALHNRMSQALSEQPWGPMYAGRRPVEVPTTAEMTLEKMMPIVQETFSDALSIRRARVQFTDKQVDVLDVTLPNDKHVFVTSDKLAIQFDIEKSAKDHGIPLQKLQKAAQEGRVEVGGKLRDLGEGKYLMQLRPDGLSIGHEHFHFLAKAVLTTDQYEGLIKRYGSEEEAAEAYSRLRDIGGRNTLLNKIRAFADRLIPGGVSDLLSTISQPLFATEFEARPIAQTYRARQRQLFAILGDAEFKRIAQEEYQVESRNELSMEQMAEIYEKHKETPTPVEAREFFIQRDRLTKHLYEDKVWRDLGPADQQRIDQFIRDFDVVARSLVEKTKDTEGKTEYQLGVNEFAERLVGDIRKRGVNPSTAAKGLGGDDYAAAVKNRIYGIRQTATRWRSNILSQVYTEWFSDWETIISRLSDGDPNSVWYQEFYPELKQSWNNYAGQMDELTRWLENKGLDDWQPWRSEVIRGTQRSRNDLMFLYLTARGDTKSLIADKIFAANPEISTDSEGNQSREIFDNLIRDAAAFVENNPELKKQADIIDAYMEMIWPRLNEVHEGLYVRSGRAKSFGKVEDYFPMLREGGMFLQEDQMGQLLRVDPGHVDARLAQFASVKKRQATDLGGKINTNVMGVFGKYINQSAIYLGKQVIIEKLTRTLAKPEVQQGLRRKFVDESRFVSLIYDMVENERHATGRATPLDATELGLRKLRLVHTIAILAGNVPSIIRQAFSGAIAAGEVPGNFAVFKIYGRLIQNMYYTLTNFEKATAGRKGEARWNPMEGNKDYERMRQHGSRQVLGRFDPGIMDMTRYAKGWLSKKIPGTQLPFWQAFMLGQRWMDMWTRTAVWNVAYEEHLAVAQKMGKSPQEADKYASEQAEDIGARTQPPATVWERISAHSQSEYKRLAVRFTGQTMKILTNFRTRVLGRSTHYYKQGLRGKTGMNAVLEYLWNGGAAGEAPLSKSMFFWYVASPMLMGAMARGKWPPWDEPEDWFHDMLIYNMAAIVPVAGPAMAFIIMYESRDKGIAPLWAELTNDVLTTGKAIWRDFTGKEELDWTNKAIYLSRYAGVPITFSKVFQSTVVKYLRGKDPSLSEVWQKDIMRWYSKWDEAQKTVQSDIEISE